MKANGNAPVEDVERMFGTEDVEYRLKRLQMAKYYGWSIVDINEMTDTEFDDAYAYMGAIANLNGK